MAVFYRTNALAAIFLSIHNMTFAVVLLTLVCNRCTETCVVVVVVVITPPLPRDGGTARTAVHVHAVYLIKLRLGERWQPILNQS